MGEQIDRPQSNTLDLQNESVSLEAGFMASNESIAAVSHKNPQNETKQIMARDKIPDCWTNPEESPRPLIVEQSQLSMVSEANLASDREESL
jgi:hypothetical protein